MTLPPPNLRHFCDLSVELGDIREMGQGRAGKRRIIPIIGGKVTGEVTGRILNLGADWQTLFADGTAELDTRYAFETTDGALIEVVNFGYRHGPEEVLQRVARGEDVPADAYYMRTHCRFETGHPDYQWMNRMLFVGYGARFASAVLVSIYVVE